MVLRTKRFSVLVTRIVVSCDELVQDVVVLAELEEEIAARANALRAKLEVVGRHLVHCLLI